MSTKFNGCPSEELRIALIMNGGVSLAVWMGGVTNEIFRLVTHQHPVYRGLLELTRTSARVDVISGTSAGGINGAALALATLYGGDFCELRETWMKTGAFADLLRHPLGENPGSLLMGDDYFLPAIEKAFDSLAKEGKPAFGPHEMPIDLKLTTTLLSGYQGRNVDDLGTPLHDVDYRAFFHLKHLPGGASDFDTRRDVVRALARAARSTASFPFAFEPSLVSETDAGKYLFNYKAKLPVPRYVVDGGVLDNKPFRGAREGIFCMPRTVGVRRVLAYINPDPGDGPAFTLPAKPSQPALSKVIASSLVGIPTSQSIADQLHEIEQHNISVRTRRESVLTLAQAFTRNPSAHPSQLEQLAKSLFPVYKKRRLTTTFELFVFEPLSAGASRKPLYADALTAIGKNGRESMKGWFVETGGVGWLPAAWPELTMAPEEANPNSNSADWAWGLFPVEFASNVMMNLLRLMQSLADFLPANLGSSALNSITELSNTLGRPIIDDGDWRDPNERRKVTSLLQTSPAEGAWDTAAVRTCNRNATTPVDQRARFLAQWWAEAFEIIKSIQAIRNGERDYWRVTIDAALELLYPLAAAGCVDNDALKEWNKQTIDQLFKAIITPTRRKDCAELAHKIATLIQTAATEGSDIAAQLLGTRSESETPLRPSDKATAESLRDLCALLKADSPKGTLRVLLQMEVAEFAFNDHEALNTDTLIELVQISGNGSSPIGGPQHAKDKLLGLQLAHFGAFYKESWRANDWTYGRLDGSARLVDVLLNAQRLHRIYFRRKSQAFADICHIAKDGVTSKRLKDFLDSVWREQGLKEEIATELAFLESPGQNVPDKLPACAKAIKLRLHYGILREELQSLSEAVERDKASGADPLWAGHALAQNLKNTANSTAPFAPDAATAGLNSGLLAGGRSGEDFVKEAGSDLFTRTFAHTVAALQNTLSSKSAKLGPVSTFFSSLWLPVLGFHFVAQNLTRQSRTAAVVHGVLLAVGVTIALFGLWFKETGAGIVTFGWLLLAFGLFMSITKAPRTVIAVLFIVSVGLLGWVSWYHREFSALAFLAVLMFIGLRGPKMQIVVAMTVVAVAAYYAWESTRSSSTSHLVLYLGLFIIITIAIATLQAVGTFTECEHFLRERTQKWRQNIEDKRAAAQASGPQPRRRGIRRIAFWRRS